jgi:hypothetical protein
MRVRIAVQHEKARPCRILEQPAFGQVRIANELRKLGLTVSRAGVRQRQDLRDHDQAAQGAGSQARPGRPGADQSARANRSRQRVLRQPGAALAAPLARTLPRGRGH